MTAICTHQWLVSSTRPRAIYEPGLFWYQPSPCTVIGFCTVAGRLFTGSFLAWNLAAGLLSAFVSGWVSCAFAALGGCGSGLTGFAV